MKTVALSAIFGCTLASQVLAWDQEGHSVVAEIAQRRLTPEAVAMVEQVLGKGHSLAAVASWADDVRDARPETYNWHFVDIPIGDTEYDPATECQPTDKGDCVVAELDRLKNDVRCASDQAKIEALKFAVHFVGDIHQPLHTVADERGGNDIQVQLSVHAPTCTGNCRSEHTNFHAAWDTGLISRVVWDWGAYVDRLESGWLKSDEASTPGLDGGTPADWATQTHQAAQTVWQLLPENRVLDDDYLAQVLPVLDRQLGLAGLRLARFLNNAYASSQCPVN